MIAHYNGRSYRVVEIDQGPVHQIRWAVGDSDRTTPVPARVESRIASALKAGAAEVRL